MYDVYGYYYAISAENVRNRRRGSSNDFIFVCLQRDNRSQFVRGNDRPVRKNRRIQRVQRDQQVSRHDHRLRVQTGRSAVLSRELLVRVQAGILFGARQVRRGTGGR